MKKIVFLSGAGVSAESGISTFRDSNGLWENYPVEEVASIVGWHQNPQLIIDFYNHRREQLSQCVPNDAHRIIAELEKSFKVTVITQNVDDLHERAGSTNIIHLHGELTKICSEREKKHVQHIGYRKMQYGNKAPDGSLMRPFIVWFGEDVPLLPQAIEEVESADIMVIIGTSLNVYPAASLYHFAHPETPIWVIDPNDTQPITRAVKMIKEKATVGMEKLFIELLQKCL
ncbi:MAG: NAD-dependent deacylase [Bacteroidales bacterium]|jgi:NAD-dependent deacetylase|nr:NAD-dependent deacylase [Bacteroidales bacterium]